jgi:bifunctional polynucleotide phosphatase/kinase
MEPWTWNQVDDGAVFFMQAGAAPVHSSSIFAFDLDDTIVTTKSGAKFATSGSDWQWLYANTPDVLRALAAATPPVKLAIMSNQKGVSDGKTALVIVQDRFEQVARALDIPLLCMFAVNDDLYRKPRINMWRLCVSEYNGGIVPDLHACVYVGDAAGRPAHRKSDGTLHKKDFSAGDARFAANVGIRFTTPEEFFLKDASQNSFVTLGPRVTETLASGSGRLASGFFPAVPGVQELVILIGPPASGKSTLAADATLFPPSAYTVINQDTLKTKAKCLSAAAAALAAGRSIIVDATNKDVETRRPWLELAAKARVPARAVLIDASKELCFHGNTFRALNFATAPADRRRVPSMVIHAWFKHFQAPTIAEGFASPVIIMPQYSHLRFASREEAELFHSYLDA